MLLPIHLPQLSGSLKHNSKLPGPIITLSHNWALEISTTYQVLVNIHKPEFHILAYLSVDDLLTSPPPHP
jgi:hypothetical protein